MLNASWHGFAIKSGGEVQHKVTHLMYMDGSKIYAVTDVHVSSLLRTVKIFSREIKVKFGLDKCKTQTVLKCKHSIAHLSCEMGILSVRWSRGTLVSIWGYTNRSERSMETWSWRSRRWKWVAWVPYLELSWAQRIKLKLLAPMRSLFWHTHLVLLSGQIPMCKICKGGQ